MSYDGLWRKEEDLPVHVLRMIQWSMMGLQLTVISKQWCALWCWADLSSGLNCRRDTDTFRRLFFQIWIHLYLKHENFTHPNCHEPNVGIFRAFHEYKRGISGVLNDNFLCNFSRSYKKIIRNQTKKNTKTESKPEQLSGLGRWPAPIIVMGDSM